MQEKSLKQRLIGAIVLVALAVIFIPMLLDGGNGEKGVTFGTNIPNKPSDQREVRVLKLEDLPQPPARQTPGRSLIDKDLKAPPPGGPVSSGPKADTAVKPPTKAAPAKSSESKGKPPAKSNAVAAPNAWVVQVGSFSHQKNALTLRDQLRRKHFPAFVDAVNGPDGIIYRVQVGPEVRRTDAEALQKHLAEYVKAKTLVVPHP